MAFRHVNRILHTDILTIGGGGAAVSAAAAAHKQGVKVTLISKGKVGRSGNTIMIGGGFGLDGQSAGEVLGKADVNLAYTRDILLANTVKNSFYLSDQNIAEQFAAETPYALQEFFQWAEDARQSFPFNPKASMWSASGRGFGNALKEGIHQQAGIEVLEDVLAVDVVVQDGKAVGAVAVDIYSGEILLIQAQAVILATGGYQPFTLKNSISDMTGDGVAMAYRAGARIADMEFLLFIPTLVEPRNVAGSILPFLMTIPDIFPTIYRVTNAAGEEIQIPAELQGVRTKLNKVILAYYWGKESAGVAGKFFYYDFALCTDEAISSAFDHLIERYSSMHKRGTYNKINLEELKQTVLRERKLKVALGNEYSMGGIEIDERMQTGVAGLFAAGEVTSGLFGAFRGGDGLTEMLAHGFRAGASAVEYIQELPLKSGTATIDSVPVDSITTRILQPFENLTSNGFSPFAVQRRVEQAADEGFNFFRDEAGLQAAADELARIRTEELPRLTVASKSRVYNFEWITSILVRNIHLCNETGVIAALQRKESRGTHMRSDYPQVDNDQWLVRILAEADGEQTRFSTRPPQVTRFPLPAGKVSSIPAYVASILSTHVSPTLTGKER